MAVLTWGKIDIKFRKYKSDAYGTSDTLQLMPRPVENSTTLNITEGDTKEAKEEGGAIVDSVKGANTYELVFQIFVKSGDTNPYPIAATNGVVDDEYEFQLIPQSNECYGVTIPRGSVSVIEQFSQDTGITLEYHVKAILDESNATGHDANGKLIKLEKNAA